MNPNSEKINAVNRQLDENENKDKVKLPETLNENMQNLYMILLQYYTTLVEKEHPMINLITDVMDKLINLKKTNPDNIQDEFNKIHSLAYNNITTIYDFDQEKEKEKEEESV